MHESIYDEFVKKAVDAAKKRVVGDPFKSGTQQGPQVNTPPLLVCKALWLAQRVKASLSLSRSSSQVRP